VSTPCAAPVKNCGTVYGWRLGGRCPACRTAHNRDANRHRTITAEDRDEVLLRLRTGETAAEAAAAVGRKAASLSKLAVSDRELRAALDGLPVAQQIAARQGDWLAALVRAGGNRAQALRDTGISRPVTRSWRKDPLFAVAEDAVVGWVQQVRGRAVHRVSAGMLDTAAQMLESGATMSEAARRIGVRPATLRNRADDHPRLKAALPPLRYMPPRSDARVARRRRQEEELRALWADESLTTGEIARRVGISVHTMYRWREEMGLPYRVPPKSSS
jgi:transposase-like protein